MVAQCGGDGAPPGAGGHEESAVDVEQHEMRCGTVYFTRRTANQPVPQ